MARIALISDIHGNIDALEAVLAEIKGQKIDEIVCLGDIVDLSLTACVTHVLNPKRYLSPDPGRDFQAHLLDPLYPSESFFSVIRKVPRQPWRKPLLDSPRR